MSATFSSLSDNDIGTSLASFLGMFWVACHVHIDNAILVEPIYDMWWWYADGRDEYFAAGLYDDVQKCIKRSFCMIVL